MMYPKIRLFLSIFLFLGMTFLSTSPTFAPPFPSGGFPYHLDLRGLSPISTPIPTPISSVVYVTITIYEPLGGLFGVRGALRVVVRQKKVLTGYNEEPDFAPPNVIMTAPVVSVPGVPEVRKITVWLPRTYFPDTTIDARAEEALTMPQGVYKFSWAGRELLVTMPPTAATHLVTWTLSP